jgi:hypothetical protein
MSCGDAGRSAKLTIAVMGYPALSMSISAR